MTFHAVAQSSPTGLPVLVVSGDLDLMTAPIFSAAARDLLTARPGATLRLDFRDVAFMDSTGIEALINIKKLAEQGGGSLELVSSSRHVERVLSVVGLSDLFV